MAWNTHNTLGYTSKPGLTIIWFGFSKQDFFLPLPDFDFSIVQLESTLC